jgi:CRP/FNR family transcriptional regulator, cyclic AMP receptor protein
MSVHCQPDTRKLLLRLNLFRGLDEAELVILLAQAELVDFAKDEYPIREGEQGRHLYVLLSGHARISKRAFGIQKVIQEMGPGECFGEMSLIECRSRSASVKALTACKLLRLGGEDLEVLPEIATKLYRNIAILLSQRLRQANEILTLG